MVRRPTSSSRRISSLFELIPGLIVITGIVAFMRIKEEPGFFILGVCAPFVPPMSTFPIENTGKELLPNNVKHSPGRRKLPFADRFANRVLLDPGAVMQPAVPPTCWNRPACPRAAVGRLGAEILKVLLTGASAWCLP